MKLYKKLISITFFLTLFCLAGSPAESFALSAKNKCLKAAVKARVASYKKCNGLKSKARVACVRSADAGYKTTQKRCLKLK